MQTHTPRSGGTHSGHPIQDAAARHTFYRHLFVALLIPALALAGLFLAPVFFLNAMDNNLSDACAVQFQDGRALRVTSETRRDNTVQFFMKWHPDEAWQLVTTRNRPYQTAAADCSNVLFLDDVTVLYLDNRLSLVNAAGAVTQVDVTAECHAIESLRRTDTPDRFTMVCENGDPYNVLLPIARQ